MGVFGPSLLIESTDSMIRIRAPATLTTHAEATFRQGGKGGYTNAL
jgi:hypothetical protein